MRASKNSKSKNSTYNHRSYFDWGRNMQVVRKGKGEIAMTEGELVRFFGVTWRKLNYRLQTIMKTSDLHPNERGAGEEEVIINGQRKGYAPLYPLPAIIALSFLLDSTEAHLFRKYISRRLQTEAAIVTPICLLGNTKN
ncbi:hypothetical protein [Prevotella sp. kh1p2]|uniref:hypothetical protein n=1 Tax=Prevotella sp. kh1p2 TaxID=1761883 RepID=UPI0008D5B62F|nr:hypothetical protein [Prevotella sp. kh1p2]SET30548.1 hypothetical protein SAMN04487825_1352 [Prevotella sp. kh1p2]SNU11027.1 hypothetical protein SAMN06298210_106148 [Prevotellaceae bacterium KH2P17]